MEKTDCFFKRELQDMGARIPMCTYHDKIGNCPCSNCDVYIENKVAFEMIKNFVDGRKHNHE